MALPDFWTNVRIGAKLFTPQAIVDSPRLDAEAIEHMLRETTHWLTPRVVDGFEKSDFSFLPSGERARLAKLVEDFSRVAAKVGPTAPPRARSGRISPASLPRDRRNVGVRPVR